jgi:hypothetical protein
MGNATAIPTLAIPAMNSRLPTLTATPAATAMASVPASAPRRSSTKFGEPDSIPPVAAAIQVTRKTPIE